MMLRVALLALVLVPLGARAADESVMEVLAAASKRLAPQVAAVLDQQQRQINGKCKLGSLRADTVTVIDTPAFNLDGMPERGSWQVRYIGEACKREVVRTVMFTGGAKGVAVEAGVPGTTMADARLAQDVWRDFQKAAVRAKPGCTDMVLRETSVIERPTTDKSIWRETWIGRVCGNEIGQVVSFYPNPKGTMYRMSVPRQALPDESKINNQ